MEDIDIIGRYEQDLIEDHIDDFLADLFDVSAIVTGDYLDAGHDHRAGCAGHAVWEGMKKMMDDMMAAPFASVTRLIVHPNDYKALENSSVSPWIPTAEELDDFRIYRPIEDGSFSIENTVMDLRYAQDVKVFDVNDMRYDQRWDANLFVQRIRNITI